MDGESEANAMLCCIAMLGSRIVAARKISVDGQLKCDDSVQQALEIRVKRCTLALNNLHDPGRERQEMHSFFQRCGV